MTQTGTKPTPLPFPCAIVELGRLIERRMTDDLRPYKVTASQFMTLTRIHSNPRAGRAELGRSLQISPQAAGGLITQLIQKGLVVKTDPPSPGLPCEYALTGEGSRLLHDASGSAISDLCDRIMSFFRPNLAEALDRSIRHIISRLNDVRESAPGFGALIGR